MTAILKKDRELGDSRVAAPPSLERLVRHCLEERAEDCFPSARDVALA